MNARQKALWERMPQKTDHQDMIPLGRRFKNSWGITVMILKRHILGIQDIVEICQGDKEYPAILGKIGINPGSEIQTSGKASDVKEVSHSGNTPETSRKALDVE